MPQNKQVWVRADSDSSQLTRVPNKSPEPPFITFCNVTIETEGGKKEKVDLIIVLSVSLLGEITKDGVKELKALQESAEV
ncbi:MAG: hypothetical protein HY505_03105 [Candidatus Yanofskybacteria bacterium]|nr:hypothetical protein [Candidatus Yanofskybacteria bacterium]